MRPSYLLKINESNETIETNPAINDWAKEVANKLIELAPGPPNEVDNVLSMLEIVNEFVLDHYFPTRNK